MFTQPVERVHDTSIFARGFPDGSQALVYSLTLESRRDLAMVLPLPIPPGAGEDAMRFVNLSHYPDFFLDMHAGFPEEPQAKPWLDSEPSASGGLEFEPLPVHDVGLFAASLVPSRAEWARLDARFQLPDSAWRGLPQYADHAFAVFALKSNAKRRWQTLFLKREAPPRIIPPMAVVFQRRDPDRLFFPMTQVYDGEVYTSVERDHRLYLQMSPEELARINLLRAERPDLQREREAFKAAHPEADNADLHDHLRARYKAFTDARERWLSVSPSWQPSDETAGRFVLCQQTEGLVQSDAFIYQASLRGSMSNQDLFA